MSNHKYIDTRMLEKEIKLIRTRRDELAAEQNKLRVREHRLRKLLEAAIEIQGKRSKK